MKIACSEKAENCLNGEFIFMYYFDTEWTKENIRKMEVFGELRYYETFPRPMFQLTCSNGTIVKGVQNEKSCRVIFPGKTPQAAREEFENSFNTMERGN